jgi:hypothetical protein
MAIQMEYSSYLISLLSLAPSPLQKEKKNISLKMDNFAGITNFC